MLTLIEHDSNNYFVLVLSRTWTNHKNRVLLKPKCTFVIVGEPLLEGCMYCWFIASDVSNVTETFTSRRQEFLKRKFETDEKLDRKN